MGHQLIFHVLNLPIEPAHLKSLTVLGFSPNFKGGQVEINIGSVSLFLSTFLLSGINVLRLIFLPLPLLTPVTACNFSVCYLLSESKKEK